MQAAEVELPRYRCNNTGAEAQAIKIEAVIVDRKLRTTTLLPGAFNAPEIDLPLDFYFDEKPRSGDFFVKQGEQVFCLADEDFSTMYAALPKVSTGVA
jgi:hypothetical protein